MSHWTCYFLILARQRADATLIISRPISLYNALRYRVNPDGI